MDFQVVDPNTRQGYFSNDVDEMVHAIEGGYIPMVAGQPGTVGTIEGGMLVNGAPMNVWVWGLWLTGQKEILDPHWRDGSIPLPPNEILNLPVTDAPPAVLDRYRRGAGVPEAQTLTEVYATGHHPEEYTGGFDLMMYAPFIAAGAALWLLLGRGSSKTPRGSAQPAI